MENSMKHEGMAYFLTEISGNVGKYAVPSCYIEFSCLVSDVFTHRNLIFFAVQHILF